MGILDILRNLGMGLRNEQITTTNILTVLVAVSILSIYEFLIYRFVSKRSFYSKQFNITLAAMPFFIATIIMTLQSNLVITLGTIGALAIIRFRTAIKDPTDMLYLFWSVHNGIICGTGLFEIGVLTSLAVTILILVLDLLPLKKASYLLIVNAEDIEKEEDVLRGVKKYSRFHRVKSRNLTKDGLDMILELRTSQEIPLMNEVAKIEGVINVSLVSHEGESIV